MRSLCFRRLALIGASSTDVEERAVEREQLQQEKDEHEAKWKGERDGLMQQLLQHAATAKENSEVISQVCLMGV